MSILDLTISLDEAVAGLRDRVAGAVLTERDPGYAESCAAWNVLFQHHPAVLVVAETSSDIAAAVRFARAGGFRVAVQATGHGVARPADGAVLIVTSKMTDVTIDPARRTAKVAAGAKWGAVLAPAQAHGLAPLLGSTTDVGAIGYTLGGGMGWLARRYGLAADSVRSFDLVTPDGELVHASSDEHAELFWALKGGGAGTLGVVTSMEIDLYPVANVYAGNLLYPIEMAAEVIARWRDWVAGWTTG
jgi:FAD/FMN-containing dehydrogenase